jgi:hypothetical protein
MGLGLGWPASSDGSAMWRRCPALWARATGMSSAQHKIVRTRVIVQPLILRVHSVLVAILMQLPNRTRTKRIINLRKTTTLTRNGKAQYRLPKICCGSPGRGEIPLTNRQLLLLRKISAPVLCLCSHAKGSFLLVACAQIDQKEAYNKCDHDSAYGHPSPVMFQGIEREDCSKHDLP